MKPSLEPKRTRRGGNVIGRSAALVAFLVLVVSPFLTLGARAEDGKENDGGTFSAYFENDLFAGTDRQYTSGVKLGWSSPNLEQLADSPYARPFLPLFGLLPGIDEVQYQKNLVFALGQSIYTPDDTESLERLTGDRPYAGWLYLGVGVVWKNAETRHSLVLDLGVVGPWSFAEESARLVHELRGLSPAKGWDHQLHNELGVVAIYQREWRWPRRRHFESFEWELLPHTGLALGNVQTYGNLGGELRFGRSLPDDFGTTAIGLAATTSTPVDGHERALSTESKVGFYGFARVDGRLVAHDIFIDGNTFGDRTEIDREWLVADLSLGAAISYEKIKLACAFVYRTRQFQQQRDGQVFGTLSINVTY